jgi:hypothetical protein
MATKKRWVELDEYSDTQIDGAKLSRDIQRVLVELESKGFDLVAITPVLSGQYGYADYSGGGIGTASTCASWGFSVTSGVTVTARKVPKSARPFPASQRRGGRLPGLCGSILREGRPRDHTRGVPLNRAGMTSRRRRREPAVA